MAALALSLATLTWATTTQAQAQSWNGATPDWFTAGNWTPSGVPTNATNAFIDTTSPNAAIISSGNAHAQSAIIGLSATGALTIQNGGTLSNAGGALGLNLGSTGTATVDGAGSSWSNSADLSVGYSGAGTLTIQSGGAVSDQSGYVGRGASASGTVTVDGAGSSWTNHIALWVGYSGTGTLTVKNGATVSNGADGSIGVNSGATGTVTIDGAGSSWTDAGNLYVGQAGTGTLVVSNGGTVSNGVDGYIGVNSGATGTVTVAGTGSSWTHAGILSVGESGTGTLTVANGGMVSNASAVIGTNAGATGTVTITGAGSSWSNAGNLTVGQDGTGTLTIAGGGVVSNTTAMIGLNSGATGTVTVTGAGSSWANSSFLYVGQTGTGTLTIADGAAVSSLIGVIGGDFFSTGSVTVTGAGSSWAISGNLDVGLDGAGTLTIANGAVVSASNVTVGYWPLSTGTLNIGAASGQTAVAPGTLNTPVVRFRSSAGSSIVFNHTSSNYVFAPVIMSSVANIGSVIVEAGTTIFTAASTYTGLTAINGGTLAVNGSIVSSTTVNSGGTLAGTGTVGSVTVNSGGRLAPASGAPGSVLTIAGNLAMQSGALYLVQVGATTASRANVSGTATLTGASVQVTIASGSSVAKQSTILHAAGGLGSTTFAGASATNFVASLSYTPTDVLLNLSAALGTGTGLNVNQQNVADTLNNAFNSGGALPANFAGVFGLTGGNLGTALSQLSGEPSTGAQQGAFQFMGQFLGLMLDPSAGGRDGAGGTGGQAVGFAPERAALPDDIALAYARVTKTPLDKAEPAFEPRWSAWASGFGGTSKTNGDAVIGSHDLTAQVAGGAAGLDYHLTRNAMVGFALAGGGTRWDLTQGLGGGKSDAFQGGIYATVRSGPAYVAASLAAANHWMSTDRLAAFGDHLTARFNAQSYGGRIEGGYRIATPLIGITPYAALQAQSFRTPSYSETDLTGGGFGLAYSARSATDTRGELGARFDRAMLVAPGTALTLRGRLAFAHDWVSDPTLSAVFQTLPGASFVVVNGATPAKDSALLSTGADLQLARGITLSAKFDGVFADRARTYAGTGTLRYRW
ncbi:autotransporter outer membrane beta-barrel domain-containing protein [Bradyrhizobium iriomotense]|uniref:autotransporter outer membrane beta-barrel domain-containing protein n=1 Tax=Bradyrhizobium iriomotense TaxID=441950 RepID=UPI001B8A605D|nr:autotransporter domain-containing protein [Bradyrhizobium iriomotense]MBR0780360.1 autotransporter domain-containing protein [Bradyrhizobium iriomotense]